MASSVIRRAAVALAVLIAVLAFATGSLRAQSDLFGGEQSRPSKKRLVKRTPIARPAFDQPSVIQPTTTAKSRQQVKRPRPTVAGAPAAHAGEINREILALYDGNDERTEADTRIHKLLEMPLNHLGYRVTYRDLRKGLPTLAETRRYKAVATWFDERIPDAHGYLHWARAAADAHVRFIIMDFVGSGDGETQATNALLSHIGLSMTQTWVPSSPDLRIVVQRETMGFERKLEGELPGYMIYKPARPSSRSHVVIGRTGEGVQQGSHPVVTGSGGGFAAYGFSALYDEKSERMAWVLDPFAFLAEALDGDQAPDLARAPIPDTTTLVGRRIYFSHIDGDGWNNVSLVPHNSIAERLVSETVLDELIKPFPDLPVSVGVIGGDVDESLAGKPKAARIAREYYRQPQVEVASHSYTHPYDWSAFTSPEKEREKEHELEIVNIASPADALKRDPLRAYARQPFELKHEVDDALDVAAALSPPGKKPALYLWSGDTRPFARAIRATRDYGVRNLNGGDTRFDSTYPSVAYVSPISRQMDGERQIYSGEANETIYTSGWTPPFDRFKQLEETIRNTDTPRRLKPFNVYYHMYSGERPESLAAVKHHLELARASKVVPIAASHFAAIADDFFAVRIIAAGHNAWRVVDRGNLQTLRFDGARGLVPDYARSSGVLGHVHEGAALYVALDPAVRVPVVAIAQEGRAPRGALQAILVDSRWQLSSLQRSACGFEVEANGYGPGEMRWSGLIPGDYVVTASRAGDVVATIDAHADASGTIDYTLPADAIQGLHVTATCKR